MSLIIFSSAPILIPERICDSYLFKYFVVRKISMNIWPVMECHDNSRLTKCNISKTISYRLCCQVLPNIMFCIRKLIACLAILIRRIHFRIFIPKAPSNIFYRHSIGPPCCENGYTTPPPMWWMEGDDIRVAIYLLIMKNTPFYIGSCLGITDPQVNLLIMKNTPFYIRSC